MLKNIDFIKENYTDQIDALNQFITDAYPYLPNNDSKQIRFGGGTALAIYYFQHRLSFDIDLFVTDPQIMNYLSPKHWLEDTTLFNKDSYKDMSDHIRVLYLKGNIKIDILVSVNNTVEYLVDDSKEIFNQAIYLEPVENIIAKKIVYRKEDNLTRDIIDLAVFLSNTENGIEILLNKNLVSINDIKILFESIKKLDKDEYLEEVEIVSPFEKYKEIAKHAPSIILNICNDFK